MKKYLTDNFTFEELMCPCCGEMKIDEHAIIMLQEMRDEYYKPMIINSGYRCHEHNLDVGGVPDSEHLVGAFDIFCVDPRERYELIKAALFVGFTCIKAYGTFIHVDNRDEDPIFLLD